ncbi:hypothetical protein EPR50_G00062450 [Perca flavescens]|uniref:Ig-like domain-containing protein n=1 Tax=Perca flavescens TaxID=8167 RepID=A0A484D8J3_PERFV|nr:hypothetical protein EPR50_G00062450 [Perca flavescens]
MKTCRSPVILLKLICITLLPVLEAQEVKVLPEVTVYLGRDVTLPCQFIPAPQGANVTQVQWDLISPEGEEILIFVFNVKDGLYVNESFKDRVDIAEQSLIIRGVEMRDAGPYTCSIASFPSGSFKGTTNLVVQDTHGPVMDVVRTSVILIDEGVVYSDVKLKPFRDATPPSNEKHTVDDVTYSEVVVGRSHQMR